MIIESIERLRRAPKTVRDRYAFLLATSFTVVVALVWMAFLPGRFTPADETLATGAEQAPFSSLFGGLKDQVAQLGALFKDDDEAAPGAVTAPEAERGSSAITLSPEEVAQGAAAVAAFEASVATTSAAGTASSTPVAQVVLIATTSSALKATTTATTTPVRAP